MRRAFVEELERLASNDPRVFLLIGDLGYSVFERFQERFPSQFLNIGVNEQAMIGMAAGLAMEGRKVFVYSIAPFLIYRPFEQIRDDLCCQRLSVKLVGVGGGLAYGPQGPTHHSIEDLGIMSSLPTMSVFAPGDPVEVREIVRRSMDLIGPCYIRLNRAGDPVVFNNGVPEFKLGVPSFVTGKSPHEAVQLNVFSVGNMLPFSKTLVEDIISRGHTANLYSVHTLKPIAEDDIVRMAGSAQLNVVLEEHVSCNGFFSLLNDLLNRREMCVKRAGYSLTDRFLHEAGDQAYLRVLGGLDPKRILSDILARLG